MTDTPRERLQSLANFTADPRISDIEARFLLWRSYRDLLPDNYNDLPTKELVMIARKALMKEAS
jgi:hypothetical protein